jgi:hypothetical protein
MHLRKSLIFRMSYTTGTLPDLPQEITRTQAKGYMCIVLDYIILKIIFSINMQSMPLPIQNMISA